MEAALNFIDNYTLAAVATGIALLVAVIVIIKSELFARKLHIPAIHGDEFEGCVFMRLKAIQLLPENPEASIHIIVYVNGMEFHYPSADKSKWISMQQAMSEVIIELPNADLYRVHLAVHVNSGQTYEGGPEVVRRASLRAPISEAQSSLPIPNNYARVVKSYPLYLLEDGLRDTTVKAVIPYEFYLQ